MDKRVLKFAAAIELITSLYLYAIAPTDCVRVWYPSVWAYMGEHGLVWAMAFAVAFSLLNVAFGRKLRTDTLTGLTCIIAELLSTAYVWFVIPANEGSVSRAWYTGRFIDYFQSRSTAWCVMAVLAVPFYFYPSFQRWRVERKRQGGGVIN